MRARHNASVTARRVCEFQEHLYAFVHWPFMDLLEHIRSTEFERKLHRTLGDEFHRAYDQIAHEELPGRLQELLHRLDASQSHSGQRTRG